MTSVTEHLTVKKGNGEQVDLADGKIYNCKGTPEFGVVQNGKLSGFPNPEIAASYSSTWSADATEIECTGVSRNTDAATRKVSATLPMTTPSAPGTTVPPTLADGKIYKCTGTAEYGIVLNNKLSGFPNPEVAASYSSTWSADATEIECTSFNRNPESAPMKTAASSSSAAASSSSAPALGTTPAAPVMACNLENFENFAPF